MQQGRTVWTTRGLIAWTTQHFEKKQLDNPRLRAEMLLSHVLGCDRLRLYMEADRPATELERAAFRDLVERASNFEPVDYLVGKTPFMSMMLKVTPATLVPRPSTEALVEHVIQHSRATPGFRTPTIADIGTGSGAIAIALAKTIKNSRVVATDISPEALEIAKVNAQEQGVADRIDFRLGSLYEPFETDRFHYICSNPPYIPDFEWDDVEPTVKKYEPESALRGGPEGLDVIRPMIEHASGYLENPGQLVVEVASSHADQCLALAKQAGLKRPLILRDHEHLPRVLVTDRD